MVTSPARTKIEIDGLTVRYGAHVAIDGLTLQIPANDIFGFIGPAKSGKSTLLKAINRTLELIPGATADGRIRIDGADTSGVADIHAFRRRIGMVFPLPVGLPMTIYDNVAFAPRMAGVRQRADLDAIVERCLTQAALWDEVKDRLTMLGTRLSGGQQQRLTLARALSHDPDILCLDEFSIAVDPVTTMRIERVLVELKARMTIILVTNLVQQARRIADRTALMINGRLVEVDASEVIFSESPASQQTYDYVHGIVG
jgi:phosphate transport system ATP-binding protein